MARHISDIKFEGTNDQFVWRSPIMDFETGSKVTVYESQEALFYMNGACVGVLGAGSHILETEHIPFLKQLIQKVTGTETIFHAQVYFVNKVEMDIKFGVGDIVYEDPMGPVFTIGTFGQMSLASAQSRKIVEKLVGTYPALSKDQVAAKFREYVTAEVSDKLVNTILSQNIRITMLSAKRVEVANLLRPIITSLFDNYGFSVEQFMLSGFRLPEDDPEYTRLKRLLANQGLQYSELQLEQQRDLMKMNTQAQKIKMEADAMAYKRSVEGYDYATEKQFEFLNKMAENESVATGISAEMLQMGTNLGVMGAVGGMVRESIAPGMNAIGMPYMQQPMQQFMYQPAQQPMQQPMYQSTQQPVQQNVQMAAPVQEDPIEVLGKLKKMLDAGLIEQAEYDAKKRDILSRM